MPIDRERPDTFHVRPEISADALSKSNFHSADESSKFHHEVHERPEPQNLGSTAVVWGAG